MLLSWGLRKIIIVGKLTVSDAYGRTHAFVGDGEPSCTVRLRDRSLHRTLVTNPWLRVGEAYMDGTLTIEDGTLGDLIEILCLNAAIAEAVRIGLPLADPMNQGPPLPLDETEVIAELDARIFILTTLLRKELPPPYPFILREEIERADVARATYFDATRQVLDNGNLRAIAERPRVIARHGPSKYRYRHMIAAADLYAELAEEYVVATPPESLDFDPPMFRELVDGATHLYQAVAHQDGTPEKLVAARRLEAFLAFTLQVDSARFSH